MVVAISSACGYYTINTSGNIISVAIIATAGGKLAISFLWLLVPPLGGNIIFVAIIATTGGNIISVAISATARWQYHFCGFLLTPVFRWQYHRPTKSLFGSKLKSSQLFQ